MMIKIFPAKVLLRLSLLLIVYMGFLAAPASAQGDEDFSFEEAKLLFGGQKIMKYRKFSFDLLDESLEEFNMLKKKTRMLPGIFKDNLLIFQVFTCEEELNVKPYIGVVRAKMLIDELVEELGMPRRKCLIQDNGPTPFDKECLAGSGVNIYLQPEW